MGGGWGEQEEEGEGEGEGKEVHCLGLEWDSEECCGIGVWEVDWAVGLWFEGIGGGDG